MEDECHQDPTGSDWRLGQKVWAVEGFECIHQVFVGKSCGRSFAEQFLLWSLFEVRKLFLCYAMDHPCQFITNVPYCGCLVLGTHGSSVSPRPGIHALLVCITDTFSLPDSACWDWESETEDKEPEEFMRHGYQRRDKLGITYWIMGMDNKQIAWQIFLTVWSCFWVFREGRIVMWIDVEQAGTNVSLCVASHHQRRWLQRKNGKRNWVRSRLWNSTYPFILFFCTCWLNYCGHWAWYSW